MTDSQPLSSELLARLRELLAKATPGKLIADAHHTKDYAGRTHGFLRSAGELVPLAGFVLSVEGMSQDQGRARMELCAETATPALALAAAAIRALAQQGEQS